MEGNYNMRSPGEARRDRSCTEFVHKSFKIGTMLTRKSGNN